MTFEEWWGMMNYECSVRLISATRMAWDEATKQERERSMVQPRPERQPCGHPVQAIRHGRDKGNRTDHWCGWCEEVGQARAEVKRLRAILDDLLVAVHAIVEDVVTLPVMPGDADLDNLSDAMANASGVLYP